ncbi:MAG: hypothetical protein QMB08_06235 [Acidimicrobiales bacterium]|jgi:hypothetical protein
MQLVDTNRYPLDRLESAGGRAFVRNCAESFNATGALVLPGFLTSNAVASIMAEVSVRVDQAFFCRREHNVFLDDGLVGIDAMDPRVRPLRTSVGSIANDLLESDGASQQLYDWPALTQFIGSVLGYSDFYRGADPLGALSINVYGDGDIHEWHFDESTFTVTIMIQEAERGGHFEFVPGMRTDHAVDLDAIKRVLDGDETQVQRLLLGAGSLSIFGGRNTMHRVTEVGGDRHRLVPVLTYDTAPGSINSTAVRELFWGRRAATLIG